MKPKICVLIPTFDNAATLRDVVQGVLPKGYPVLVVDDGSRVPATALLADVAGDLHVLRHATNRGKGAALCTGSRGHEKTASRTSSPSMPMDNTCPRMCRPWRRP